MIHLILIILCISLAEFSIRSKFFTHLHSLFLFFKKLIWLMPNKKISDHWKELIIPVYALMMMINSLKIILILSFIIFSFICVNYIYANFLYFSLSPLGILESLLSIYLYLSIRARIRDR